MAFLAEFHWGWLLGAGLLGLAMGWISVVQRGTGLSRRGLQWSVTILVVALTAAVAQLVPGRFGYWLDLGLALFGAYLVGCVIGAWLRRLVVSRHAAT
jgi:hypothetical protein